MKIITIANDKWERALLKSNRGGEVFLNPAQDNAKEILINYLTKCIDASPDETFLILCNDFDTATFKTLGKILETLGVANQSLILFGINHFEVGIIHRLHNIHGLKNQKALGFFRAVYDNSYWNVIGKFNLK